LEDIITISNKVYNDCESDMVVRIWKLRNLSWDTSKSYIIVELNAGSWILTLELQVRKNYDL